MLKKGIDGINRVIEIICTVILAMITVLLFYQAISRYLLNHAYFWIEEFARYSMLAMTFFGSVLCVRRHAHTRIEYFVMKIPGTAGKVVSTFATVCCLILCVVLGYYSTITARSKMRMNLTSLPIPAGVFTYIITLSFVLMAIGFVLDIVETWRRKEAGK